VLVVDDSAFARTVLSRVLRASGDIDVVDTARDGDDALEKIGVLDPDVVTLDLTMPGLDGLGVLRALAGRARPRVIVVSVSTIDSAQGVEALSLGAIDLISKPSALATDRLYELGAELVAKVRATSIAPPGIDTETPAPQRAYRRADLVLIGTSTGGPQALTRVLAGLPADLAAPIAMVLHIPIGYTAALAKRLDGSSPLEVLEAYDGIELKAGRAVLARAGVHLRVARDGNGLLVGRLDPSPPHAHVPSVDELFRSGARIGGAGTLGVVLTGMGDDGLRGSREIAAGEGQLIAEAASTCVVYGMPRCVAEADLGARSVPLDNVAREIVNHVNAP